MCEGSCELEAAGTCKGSCEGSCEWTPPKAECEGNAKVVCNMEADVEIECKAGCEGEVRPPKVEAECNAAIEARAKAEIECHPPSLDINFKYKAGIDAKAQAEFRAMLRNFKIHYSAMLALEAQLVALVEASGDLAAEAGGAVEGAVSAALKAAEGETELAVRIKLVGGLSCAISELENVGKALKDATEDADASISALATVSSGFKTRTR